MKRLSRILFLLSIFLMVVPFFTPIWRVMLQAPQYPEPIGIYIHTNTIKGINENDLENINLLNHYIGMKQIIPESIPELQYMPYLILGFIITGLMVFFLNRTLWVGIWLAIVLAFAFAGLYDFYLWEVDYGTSLNPNAPIKVANMTYIPPLIGSKQLLNITASSYPAFGGIVFIFSIILAILSIALNAHNHSTPSEPTASDKGISKKLQKKEIIYNTIKKSAILLGIFITLTACSKQPEPIQHNHDTCQLCKMLISDARFGAEIVTNKGKIYKFDSIECMTSFLRATQETIMGMYTVDYSMPHTLIDASNAYYLHTELIPSPMGANILSFAHKDSCENYYNKYKGEKLTFEIVKAKFVISEK